MCGTGRRQIGSFTCCRQGSLLQLVYSVPTGTLPRGRGITRDCPLSNPLPSPPPPLSLSLPPPPPTLFFPTASIGSPVLHRSTLSYSVRVTMCHTCLTPPLPYPHLLIICASVPSPQSMSMQPFSNRCRRMDDSPRCFDGWDEPVPKNTTSASSRLMPRRQDGMPAVTSGWAESRSSVAAMAAEAADAS